MTHQPPVSETPTNIFRDLGLLESRAPDHAKAAGERVFAALQELARLRVSHSALVEALKRGLAEAQCNGNFCGCWCWHDAAKEALALAESSDQSLDQEKEKTP